ncbi:MAG: hypothetical protein MUE44_03010 [Oscillatoriaceae cyanobacterium Prado104]|jgi:hypothetical protein|nr:hypothetical protein [Oscillatoriaceae cyanobacterium Prado104]
MIWGDGLKIQLFNYAVRRRKKEEGRRKKDGGRRNNDHPASFSLSAIGG